MESCGTRGRAPFDVVLTHGFTLDEKGRKMSKSLGNQTFPQDVIKASGADILRLWVASVDYSDDQRIGPEILKTVGDNYRKLRNTHALDARHAWRITRRPTRSAFPRMGELERLMLHRLAELDAKVRDAYADFDYARVVAALSAFMNADLSAFYFDIRKDALYCEAPSSAKRRGALEAIEHIFRAVTRLARADPRLHRRGGVARARPERRAPCISSNSRSFPPSGATTRWRRNGRRSAASVRSSPARSRSRAPTSDRLVAGGAPARLRRAIRRCAAALEGVDFAEVCITSDITIERSAGAPEGAFRLAETPGVAVVVERAKGVKCARSWRYFDPETADPEFPDVSPRDAAALARTERGAAGLMRARTLGAWRSLGVLALDQASKFARRPLFRRDGGAPLRF